MIKNTPARLSIVAPTGCYINVGEASSHDNIIASGLAMHSLLFFLIQIFLNPSLIKRELFHTYGGVSNCFVEKHLFLSLLLLFDDEVLTL